MSVLLVVQVKVPKNVGVVQFVLFHLNVPFVLLSQAILKVPLASTTGLPSVQLLHDITENTPSTTVPVNLVVVPSKLALVHV